MTEEEFAEWRKNKLLYGMHWRRLIDRNTAELVKYNQTAVKYINGETPQIFASGYNSVAEQIPDSPVAGFDFELINADTVNNLIHEEGITLPKKKLDPEKDKQWNAKLINAQILQGIMQGESIPKMAKRMLTVANSDLAGATRTARTMHTAAQNCGRQAGYNKAAKDGIIFEKTWLAANQPGRTRDTHLALSGTTIPYDEKFVTDAGNELEFPGDWRAPAEEVYNCRCTMITKFKGFMKLKDAENVPDRETPKGNKAEDYEWKEKILSVFEEPVNIKLSATRSEAEEAMFGDEHGLFRSIEGEPYSEISNKLFIEIANTLSILESRFNIIELHRQHRLLGLKPFFMHRSDSIASCAKDGTMKFNPEYFKTVKDHKNKMILNRLKGIYMPFSNEHVLKYAFTHEYGHSILYYHVKYKIAESNDDKGYAIVSQEIKDIALKANPQLDLESKMSIYAATNDQEFFAECFANSQCGKPNELGEAMKIWLKEKGYLK